MFDHTKIVQAKSFHLDVPCLDDTNFSVFLVCNPY